MTKKPMTVEEMNERWPDCPPFEARWIRMEDHIGSNSGGLSKLFSLDQDSIQEIREYLDAVEECLNG